jgi:voltage-gated potassium channel
MTKYRRLRLLTHDILDRGSMVAGWSLWVHRTLIFFIITNVTVDIFASVPDINKQYHSFFLIFEIISFVIFFIEYLLRVWSCVEFIHLKPYKPWKARLKYMLRPMSIIDFLAFAPLLFGIIMGTEARAFLLLRLVRFFKLARYSTGMVSLIEAVNNERNSLIACLGILCGAVLMSASAMHLAEQVAQPDKFGTIPDAMYWAIITLTTVGYGDYTPITPLGKVIAGVTAVSGLVMLALPVGIIASAFAQALNRRDFVVTWSMVARVPLFSKLDAGTIAEIMQVLKSRSLMNGETIFRKGDPSRGIYFIAEGHVIWVQGKEQRNLEKGDFFGEKAVLHRGNHLASAKAVGKTKLLVLEADDLSHIMHAHEDFSERLREASL